ncbi:ATP-binding cassette domain-containing protein [Aeromicrobium sp. YIM 150415]|uniref:ABC transporter ATP-binding protein n=1 Tax=Aeromicrobium sp. YIM 150415 TaxID=2803912 RepID=UPI001962B71E|nr:oligopeptide/dipeptide ABC transporter ATP-binding protein [Aeromicrobium sp. YIM 150415]MBM9463221.1 ATP-binding cassette domain-containing protein [Aeromicrobium sp. YIM 150415]
MSEHPGQATAVAEHWTEGAPLSSPLLSCHDLEKRYGRGAHAVQAVAGVSLGVMEGETLGLVGESGCGKSTLARTLLRLEAPTAGTIRFAGDDLTGLKGRRLRSARRDFQIILQDPYTSLNPRMTISQTVLEPLIVHGIGDRAERRAQVAELLERVGLNPAFGKRFPHELSGGQRQRVGIARALALRPRFIVCDEAVSALDVSIQAQVLNLLADLRDSMGLTYLFVSHNLGVVRHIADRVAVMYLGKIVEVGRSEEFFEAPRHPYSQLLLSAVLEPDPDIEPPESEFGGEAPSPSSPPSGCRFRTRCPFARDLCAAEEPELRSIGGSRAVACHFWDEIAEGRAEPKGRRAVDGPQRENGVDRG